MDKDLIAVGDVLRFRKWDDMAQEFGLTHDGNIRCLFTFISGMKNLCGQEITVHSIFDNLIVVNFKKSNSKVPWAISAEMLESLNSTQKVISKNKQKKHIHAHCAYCGGDITAFQNNKSSNGKYVCNTCSRINGLGFENNVKVHRPTSTHKTYGFELESVPKSHAHYLSMINSHYRIIPTSDCTLPSNGVEFKTPTYNGLNGVRTLFKSFDKNLKFNDSRCGQHINIGDTHSLNAHTMENIRRNTEPLNMLACYMQKHQHDVIKVCGRYFTRWASYDHNQTCYQHHSSWINLSHGDRVEFRLSKFVNPNQYFALTCMWTEILDIMVNDIAKKTIPNKEIGTKLVNIFKKYVDGKAQCQKRVAYTTSESSVSA